MKQTITELWEILVPMCHPNGDRVSVHYHRLWDVKVREIAGGLTLLPTVRGAWDSFDGYEVYEEMIPVRIACSYGDIQSIMCATMDHYGQESIIVHKVSGTVVIMEKKDA